MKYLDCVKGPAKTNLEVWGRWKNDLQSQLISRHYSSATRIKVEDMSSLKLKQATKRLCAAYSHYKCACGATV